MAGVIDWFKFVLRSRRKQLRGPSDVNCKEAVAIMNESADALYRLIVRLLPSDKTPRLPRP